jgi:hypothetical protein
MESNESHIHRDIFNLNFEYFAGLTGYKHIFMGPTGDTGYTGPTGDTGATGHTGPTGDTETDYSVSKTILEDINREYQTFIRQKETMSNTMKDSHKKILAQLEDLRFPVLNQYLSTKFTSVLRPGYKCDICRVFTVNTLKGLAAHKRGCIRKNPIVNTANTVIL